MPHHFEFDPDHRVILVILEGDVSDQEMLMADAEVKAYATQLNPSAAITDASTVTAFKVTSDTIGTLAAQRPSYTQETPRFLVAPTDYLFGMARMYQIRGEHSQTQVVRSRGEALATLGIQNPRFERQR